MAKKRFKTFEEFWPYYVSQHLNPINRGLHFVGVLFAFLTMIHWVLTASAPQVVFLGFVTVIWIMLKHIGIALFGGYLFAWVGHFVFEKNKPATFQYPLWSLQGDFRMWRYMLEGKMEVEVRRSYMRYATDQLGRKLEDKNKRVS
jgi:hypothetical protein